MNHKIYYAKIVIGLTLSFILSGFIGNEFFIGQSSQIRPHLPEYIAGKFTTKVENLITSFPKFTPLTIDNSPVDNNSLQVQFKEKKVKWQQYEFNVRGKMVPVNVPRGEQPPPQEAVDKIL